MDLISFGTNDLTQLMFGLSRADYQAFLPQYKGKKIIHNDPFQALDAVLQKLISQATRDALAVNAKLSFFIAAKSPADLPFIFQTFKTRGYIVASPHQKI